MKAIEKPTRLRQALKSESAQAKHNPETALLASVVEQALADLRHGTGQNLWSAWRFFFDDLPVRRRKRPQDRRCLPGMKWRELVEAANIEWDVYLDVAKEIMRDRCWIYLNTAPAIRCLAWLSMHTRLAEEKRRANLQLEKNRKLRKKVAELKKTLASVSPPQNSPKIGKSKSAD